MTQSIGCSGEFNWHEWVVPKVKELQLVPIVIIPGLQMIQHAGMDDARQEIVYDNILIVESHEPLNLCERHPRIVCQSSVVKSQEETVELGNDGVLVVARISNEGTAWIRIVTWQVCCFRITSADLVSQQECHATVVHVWLVVRSATINVIQVECRITEVCQRIGIVLLLQATGWVERQVVINKLAQVGIKGRYSTFFLILAVLRRIEVG